MSQKAHVEAKEGEGDGLGAEFRGAVERHAGFRG